MVVRRSRETVELPCTFRTTNRFFRGESEPQRVCQRLLMCTLIPRNPDNASRVKLSYALHPDPSWLRDRSSRPPPLPSTRSEAADSAFLSPWNAPCLHMTTHPLLDLAARQPLRSLRWPFSPGLRQLPSRRLEGTGFLKACRRVLFAMISLQFRCTLSPLGSAAHDWTRR